MVFNWLSISLSILTFLWLVIMVALIAFMKKDAKQENIDKIALARFPYLPLR